MSVRPAAPAPFSRSQIAALPAGWQVLSYVVLNTGMLAVVGTDADLTGEHQRTSSQRNNLGTWGNGRIWIATAAGWMDGPAFLLETPFPTFNRFGDGRWLVVEIRTQADTNARVLDADGRVLDRFMLGDGIRHVAIDEADRIWVGWFDEGVFGNAAWRVPDRDWAPSSKGVACFSDDGTLLPLVTWPDEAEAVADCYALNSMGQDTWVCTYTGFELVHIVPGKSERWWRNGITAAKAIAIDGSCGLLAGGYRGDANRLALVSLEGAGRGENTRLIAEWSLPMRPRAVTNEWEPAWKRPELLTGRGDVLHLVDDNIWHTWRVSDVAALI